MTLAEALANMVDALPLRPCPRCLVQHDLGDHRDRSGQ